MEMNSLGDAVRETLSYIERDDELDLPVRVIEQHTWLAKRSNQQLHHLVVAAAIHLGARQDVRPGRVLEAAIDSVKKFRDWDALREKIMRIQAGIEPEEDGDEEAMQVRGADHSGEDAVGPEAAAESGAGGAGAEQVRADPDADGGRAAGGGAVEDS